MAVSVSRRITMTRPLEEALFQHFIHQKLEIAYAIDKPFPFFEGLRDNNFITDTLYRESLEACRNLVPVSRVVYNILTKLEKTFSLSFLEVLFGHINLYEYPSLTAVFKSFKNVVTSHRGWSRSAAAPQEAPASTAERSSVRPLLPLPACQGPPPSGPSLVPSVSEPAAPVQPSTETLPKPPSPAGLAKTPPGIIQEGRLTPVSSDSLILQTEDKEDTPEVSCTPSGSAPAIKDDSPKPRDPEELQEAPRMPPNKKGKKKKRCIWATPKRRHKKKCLPRETTDDIPEVVEGKRPQEPPSRPTRTANKGKERNIYSCSSSKKRQKKSLPQEKPKDKTLDFHSLILPVTCGEAKGILYKEKMKLGSSEKCIQNEEGVWFTPREFEIEGKRKQKKYWKRSVLCGGKTLEHLIKKGLLICPPKRSLKRKPENSKECEVCCGGGLLLCCDTCPRAFHENCHIPPAVAKRRPWSCTFCRMREASGSQRCLRGSEGLARQMPPEEQLVSQKCEFLLLKAYCHPQSSFFAETPRNIRDYGEPFKEAMWLDLVKERLTERVYTVAWFLRDMRLIFRNHQMFYKASDFGQIGLDLEAEFEKDLKKMFIVHEAR
ncbi:sp110 nuclear body protein isoform X6 [Phacochoerus africanus]|uniref:sp110 nuclear body protein isoform X6 n=1 Tax=Phacochoerus africanus TaxID=41426 RepID=UPI001FDA43DD|nr:sp110 nuclear body protein isoform X6 [Phacochoerus africanus]